jgi:hypothetical protein
VFAVFHILWAAGWYPLLDAAGARAAFAIWWKWTFDVVVAGMCVVAVPVMLAPVTSWGARIPQRLVRSLAYVGTALLVPRSTASLVQTGYFVATDRFRFAAVGIWEWWFHLGPEFTSVELNSGLFPISRFRELRFDCHIC